MAEYIDREALLLHIKDLSTWRADATWYPEGMFDCEDVVKKSRKPVIAPSPASSPDSQTKTSRSSTRSPSHQVNAPCRSVVWQIP